MVPTVFVTGGEGKLTNPGLEKAFEAIGSARKYMRTCTGEKIANSLRESGVGSHTETSHTSRVSSGCDLDSGVLVKDSMILPNKRIGVVAVGEESTGTLRALGVVGSICTFTDITILEHWPMLRYHHQTEKTTQDRVARDPQAKIKGYIYHTSMLLSNSLYRLFREKQ